MSEEPTKIPRSGSLARKSAASNTDKVFDDAVGVSKRIVGIVKKVAAFGSSGGAGSGIGQILAASGIQGVEWWMTGGAALLFHVAIVLGDFATRALDRIKEAAHEAKTLGVRVEAALEQLGTVVKRMDASQAGHEALGKRISAVEAEVLAWKEERERAKLLSTAEQFGLEIEPDITIEELRMVVKRAQSQSKLRPYREYKPKTDETAVPPPESFDDELRPEGH